MPENVIQPGVQPRPPRQPGPFKAPSGFRLRDVKQPEGGLEPVPGGPRDVLTTEQAGKVQMQRTALKGLDRAKELLFDKDGSVNWTNVVTSQQFFGVGGIPKTKGRELRAAMELGIQAITRLETGAAMPQSEVDNTRERFMPKPGDLESTVKFKVKMFEEFINGNLKLVDPTGRFLQKRFDEELAARQSRAVRAKQKFNKVPEEFKNTSLEEIEAAIKARGGE